MGRRAFSIYVADAFAECVFGGNQAGVVLLGEEQDFPSEQLMRKIAGEMKHSETAFVKRAARDAFRVRYFTPVEEVALCGHATIGAFGVLYAEGLIEDGNYWLYPGAGEETEGQETSETAGKERPLQVTVSQGNVWMDMASPKVEGELTRGQALELYAAYGLDGEKELSWLQERNSDGELSHPQELLPAIVNTGLPDIMLPVGNLSSLNGAVQDREKVIELSRRYQVTGVHMFCFPDEKGSAQEGFGNADSVTAHCRNFAPAVGIDEESATGTSNGALTWYLYQKGLLVPSGEHIFIQGEAFGKTSCIKSRLEIVPEGDGVRGVIRIGGRAQISLKGQIYVEEQEVGL